APEKDVDVIRDGITDPDLTHLEVNAPPGRAPRKRQHVAAVAVDVHLRAEEPAEDEAARGGVGRGHGKIPPAYCSQNAVTAPRSARVLRKASIAVYDGRMYADAPCGNRATNVSKASVRSARSRWMRSTGTPAYFRPLAMSAPRRPVVQRSPSPLARNSKSTSQSHETSR